MSGLLYKEESYKIIGLCMTVHTALGGGFLEIVYKDALMYEFQRNGVKFERERGYEIPYRDIILPHKFYADFVVEEKIILEVKAVSEIKEDFTRQTLNYLAVSELKLGIIVNFGRDKLTYKRVLL